MQLTWFGHSAFLIDTGEHQLLIDPYLSGNAAAPVTPDKLDPQFILLTHAHFDHLGDAVPIAKRAGSTVVCNYELGEWFQKQGVAEDKVVAMNPGGAAKLAFGRVKMTIAHHSSSLPDGSYGGVPAGYLLDIADKRIYISGDTALFLDMKLIGLAGIDLAILPIGDLYTMGPEDSIEAVKLLKCRRVVPCHYNTWPPIIQDPQEWAAEIKRQTAAEPLVLELGESAEV
jgi:L-ascorbate metabolism protein UlaG (beta-lactamase superfamily)